MIDGIRPALSLLAHPARSRKRAYVLSVFLIYSFSITISVRSIISVTLIATAMVLLHRFYCIFVYYVLIILDLYFASWAAVRA